ncbi:MAG: hydroxymethylbilane synthase [Alicyclobacillaceae bacterium]|nr:hydroxymethylbilane synthase [Alicyclobacillaceae bacterium]
MTTVRVASRKSELAMTQTKSMIAAMQKIRPDFLFEIVPVVTRGDEIVHVPLSEVGGKGLFVSEIEQLLLKGHADLAVHSMKDVPAELAEGLTIGCVPVREDPRDALLTRHGEQLRDLPMGGVVGTSSLRRAAQIHHLRPDLVIQPLRGNIDTRVKRLQQGDFDAIVLASAGLSRMGWSHLISERIDPHDVLPAIGQGALAIECVDEEGEVRAMLRELTHEPTLQCVQAERTLLKLLGGSCQVPIAGHAEQVDAGIRLTGLVATTDGKTVCKATSVGGASAELGQAVARQLQEQGASDILAAYV